jgi:hypothetical protein
MSASSYTGTENIQALRTSKIPSTRQNGPAQATAPGPGRQAKATGERLPRGAALRRFDHSE